MLQLVSATHLFFLRTFLHQQIQRNFGRSDDTTSNPNMTTTLTESEKKQLEPYFQGYIHSTGSHPVDFDDAWDWLGYSTKGNAKRKLELLELKKETILIIDDKNYRGAGQPAQKIMMSVDGFKLFAMLAQTDRGNQVRMYYLQLETHVHALKRSIDSGEVVLVQGDAARKRARAEAAEDRDEELAELEFQEAKMKHQQAVVEHRQSLLAVYRRSLGNLDAREEINLKDLAKRLLNPSTILNGQAGGATLAICAGGGEEPPKEISIPIVCMQLGKKPGKQSSKIGKVMAKKYKDKYNAEPPKRRVTFQGKPIDENAYYEADTDLMEEAIKEVLG
jgi:phage anti-repressor protein